MKNTLKEIWRLVYPVLIYFAVAFVVQTGGLIFYISTQLKGMDLTLAEGTVITQAELTEFINKYSLQITALTNLILIPIFIIFLQGDNKRRQQSCGFRYAMPGIKDLVYTVILGMSAAISVNVVVSLSGLAYLSPKYQEVTQIIYSGSIAMEIISAVIAAPILEELFFRGMIYQRLRGYCNVIPAILISSLFFGAFHGNLVQFVYAFLIGCMLAFVYERFKTIWAPVVFHVGANLLSVLITELLAESYMTVYTVFGAMMLCVILTFALLKYVSRYEAVKMPLKGREG